MDISGSEVIRGGKLVIRSVCLGVGLRVLAESIGEGEEKSDNERKNR